MKLQCMIVEDEPSGRKVLEEYIAETNFLELVAKAENPVKALAQMQHTSVDLMFLDIEMPKMNGIDFLKTLKNPPMVILTTAFLEYALQGFELEVIDYLLKPISLDRFLKASNKAKDFYVLRHKKRETDEYFFVKSNNKFEKVLYDELLYAEACNNYVVLQTKQKRLITYLTLKAVEETLPAEQFVRVHKSFIVSLANIDNLDGEEIRVANHTIPISRSMKDEVLRKIVSRRLVKR